MGGDPTNFRDIRHFMNRLDEGILPSKHLRGQNLEFLQIPISIYIVYKTNVLEPFFQWVLWNRIDRIVAVKFLGATFKI